MVCPQTWSSDMWFLLLQYFLCSMCVCFCNLSQAWEVKCSGNHRHSSSNTTQWHLRSYIHTPTHNEHILVWWLSFSHMVKLWYLLHYYLDRYTVLILLLMQYMMQVFSVFVLWPITRIIHCFVTVSFFNFRLSSPLYIIQSICCSVNKTKLVSRLVCMCVIVYLRDYFQPVAHMNWLRATNSRGQCWEDPQE